MASASPVLQLMVAHILLMCYRWLQVGTRSGDVLKVSRTGNQARAIPR